MSIGLTERHTKFYNYAIITPDLREYYRKELANVLNTDEVDNVLELLPEEFHIVSFPAIE